MNLFLDITRAILPLIIVSVIAIFVILRMKRKNEKDTLHKETSQDTPIWLSSIIPFGMMAGFSTALLLSFFSPITLLSATTLGPAIGMLFGYFIYEIYRNKEKSHS